MTISTMNPTIASTRVVPRCAYSCVAFLVTIPVVVQGQSNPDSVKLRNDCRFAAQIIESGRPAPHRSEALDILPACGGSATPTLVRLWEQNDLSEADQVKLKFASVRILSDALVSTLLRTAGSSDRPVMVRATALAALVSIVDPGLIVTAHELVEERPGRKRLLARRSHRYSQVGRESVTIPVLSAVSTLVHQLSADPSPAIRRAAAMIAYGFESYGIVPEK
jgi:hypothetical protein